MKGFKSFASATTMRLEPGITCIVGPNGSGKSNVVDALAWVMGEQGPRACAAARWRTSSSPAPPAAHRSAAPRWPSRSTTPTAPCRSTTPRSPSRGPCSATAARSTPSTAPCRLLDVQELLSDSGIGREMHVIVGQGHDTVLRATPEERRGFIEEAAVCSSTASARSGRCASSRRWRRTHPRRRPHREIRRQLGPLGRQGDGPQGGRHPGRRARRPAPAAR